LCAAKGKLAGKIIRLQTFAGKPLILTQQETAVNKQAVDWRGILPAWDGRGNSVFGIRQVEWRREAGQSVFFEKLVDFIIVIEKLLDFLFFFLGGEKLGGVVQFRQDLVVQVEVFVSDVGQGGFQSGLLAQGLDFTPSPVLSGGVFPGSLGTVRARHSRNLLFLRLRSALPVHC
jgi:hypothetical protein